MTCSPQLCEFLSFCKQTTTTVVVTKSIISTDRAESSSSVTQGVTESDPETKSLPDESPKKQVRLGVTSPVHIAHFTSANAGSSGLAHNGVLSTGGFGRSDLHDA